MKNIRKFLKDIIKEHNLNPVKEVLEYAFLDDRRTSFFQKELQKVIDAVYDLWGDEVTYSEVINGGGSDEVVSVRKYFSYLMREIEKHEKKLYSFKKIGLFLGKTPHSIMHYCASLESEKEKPLFNIFKKHYNK